MAFSAQPEWLTGREVSNFLAKVHGDTPQAANENEDFCVFPSVGDESLNIEELCRRAAVSLHDRPAGASVTQGVPLCKGNHWRYVARHDLLIHCRPPDTIF